MAFTALFLLLWVQKAFAQSCNETETFSLISSTTYKSLTYAAATSSNCSYKSGPFSFTVVNPSSHQFAYYASQGLQQCLYYWLYGVYSFDEAHSNPNGTNASFVSIAQVPCVLSPCCVILQCQSSLGCPNLTLNTLWTYPSNPSSTVPFNYLNYVYLPGGVIVSVSAIILFVLRFFQCSFLCLKCFAKEDEAPELSEPIVPGAATEETPLKIRKPRKPADDGQHV